MLGVFFVMFAIAYEGPVGQVLISLGYSCLRFISLVCVRFPSI